MIVWRGNGFTTTARQCCDSSAFSMSPSPLWANFARWRLIRRPLHGPTFERSSADECCVCEVSTLPHSPELGPNPEPIVGTRDSPYSYRTAKVYPTSLFGMSYTPKSQL